MLEKKLNELVNNFFVDLGERLTKVVSYVCYRYNRKDFNELYPLFTQTTGIVFSHADGFRSDEGDHDTWLFNWYVEYEGKPFVLQWSAYYDSHNGTDLDDPNFCLCVEKQVTETKIVRYKEG